MSEEWNTIRLGELITLQRGFDLPKRNRKPGNVPIITSSGFAGTHNQAPVTGPGVVTGRYGTIGQVFFIAEDFWPHNTALFVSDFKGNDPLFVSFLLRTIDFHTHSGKSGVPGINRNDLHEVEVKRPPIKEQKAIAKVLRDVDDLLASLDGLIAKKRAVKLATMQQLLTGEKRLAGWNGRWETATIEDVADCLDHLRVPLNESQRNKMRGNIPYCGANGIIDYVNDYVVDDDIILIAEDGGYFDEYATRPIAYRMIGKCWVNNHAHILKAKEGFSQGFLFYSLVHKDIQKHLASGTRAKLNKSEMYKIEVFLPPNKEEQDAIATILSDMDVEISALQARRDKTAAIKQGMMQELLTGQTRLV